MNLLDVVAGLNLDKLLENDKKFYCASIPVSNTVAAGVTTPTALTLPPKGVFVVLSVTGKFTTLTTGPDDNGICALSLTLKNNSGRFYIADPMDMDLWFTPGRMKDTADAAAANPEGLQFPGFPWIAVWQGGETITHTVTNAASYANTWKMAYHGIWLNKQ